MDKLKADAGGEPSVPVREAVLRHAAGAEEYASWAGVDVTLTQDEAAFVLNELHSQGHGHGSSKDDFEPECPSCTAADKLKAVLAAGVSGTQETKERDRG